MQPPKRVELAHPIIDAELLYAAKVKKPKRPRRRASRTMAKKGPLKSKGVMGIGVGGIGAGGGGSGMSSPGLSAAKPSTTSGSTAVRRSLARRKPRPTKTGDPGTREEGNVRYLSADDSNSTASPVLVRQAIRAGRYVDPSLVRTYEFLNYHSFDYTPAADDKSLSIAAHMRKTTKPNEISMQVAVRSADRSPSQMQPLQATLLLDTSGSMAGPSMALARQFIAGFVAAMRPNDRLSIVVANREASVLLENHTVGPQTAVQVQEVLDKGAQANDVTNIEAGIAEAYRLAQAHSDDAYANRVVLISDGAANFGRLSKKTITKHAEDADKQGIYLAGVGLGSGFNDQLMNFFTDRGRGAYLFLDTAEEVAHAVSGNNFVANFDMSVKDVRLKMRMPDGWSVKSFHGEQISRVKSKVTPQYLAPNDQMIYHMILDTQGSPLTPEMAAFTFEAEYTPIGGSSQKASFNTNVEAMLGEDKNILKGDALVVFAETIKKMRYPLDSHRDANLALFDRATLYVADTQRYTGDGELFEIVELMTQYRKTLDLGEQFPNARDKQNAAPDAVLGLSPEHVRKVSTRGARPKRAIKGLTRLLNSRKLTPLEGYQFLALSTGPVGNSQPTAGGALRGDRTWRDPKPRFSGKKRARGLREPVYDLHQVTLELTAPANAQSFSFAFNYFSAEYPNFINQDYNDTFYAILEAQSTNGGAKTNISFDANNNTIEVDNNYFEGQFHPIPNVGTGFDNNGSTGWLRTSWPIKGGESFTLTFSIHDEGDAIFDSMAILDNFEWHDYPAVGTTDPLN